MKRRCSKALVLCALGAMFFVSPSASRASEQTGIVILKEHAVGGTAQAQTFVDRLMARVQKIANLKGVRGVFYTNRARAMKWINAESPGFGIVSLAALLDFRDRYGLSVIGKAVVSQAGGRQYYMVSSSARSLDECKGSTLSSDHLDDVRFVEKIVAAGDFKVADFTQVPATRPVQTLKKVISGAANCALIDDAQLDYAKRLDGGSALHTVWKSKKLPPMAVVAFGPVDAKTRARFKKGLSKICSGGGEATCKEAGISSLSPASDADYAGLFRRY
ncbi:MAG: PhnD/SsuA/transferrin family substrate-binding protein [Nannocystaceae bacterium]